MADLASTENIDMTPPGSAPVDIAEFHDYVRGWVRHNLQPKTEQGRMVSTTSDSDLIARVAAHRQIQERLYSAGLAGIRYPLEYGGQGLTKKHQQIYIEETSRYQMPTELTVTLGILGPTILDHGTEEQKQRYVRAMLQGRGIWVQLLSEPSSGSDMAGALTRAARDGDAYVVNGSKIWTTRAHIADYGLLLARTNPDAPKHRGLSMLITPLSSPGVTISPIRLANGSSEFCEEHFDDVLLPASNLLGAENDGWAVASRLLYHERQLVGGIGLSDTPAHVARTPGEEYSIVSLGHASGGSSDPVTRQLIGHWLTLELLAPHAAARISEAIRSGAIPGPGASLLKLLGAEVDYRQSELEMKVAGSTGVAWSRSPSQDVGNGQELPGIAWIVARTATIAGGTNEMQLNQISERVLGLPREHTPDRDLPFSQVRHGPGGGNPAVVQ